MTVRTKKPVSSLIDKSEGQASEFFWTANAYLDSAMRLCENLIDDGYDTSTHHFRVPLHLAYLSIELYMKGAICFVGKTFACTHDLNELQKQFDTTGLGVRLPIPKYLDNLIPRAPELFPAHIAPTSAWHFERLRYPSDSKGKPFPRLEIADLKQLQQELLDLHTAAFRLLLLVWK